MRAIGRPAGPVRTPLTDLDQSEMERFDQTDRGPLVSRPESSMSRPQADSHPLSHRHDALHRQLLQLRRQSRALDRRHCHAEGTRAGSGEARLSALRLQLGLRTRPVALRRIVGPLRLKARLRHQHYFLDSLRIPHRIRRLSRHSMDLQRDLRPSPSLRPGAVAGLPWKRAHRRRMVPHGRARRCLSNLQRLSVFRSGRLCSALRMAHPHLRLAKLLLVHGPVRLRARLRMVEDRL